MKLKTKYLGQAQRARSCYGHPQTEQQPRAMPFHALGQPVSGSGNLDIGRSFHLSVS
jgi:hypothetical protein